MSLLSDFFVATTDEVCALDLRRSPMLSLPTVMGRGLSCPDIGQLESIVYGSLPEAPKDEEPCETYYLRWRQDFALRIVRPAVVEALAGADEALLAEWARTWASVNRLRGDDFTPERIGRLVSRIGRLARQAGKPDCGMFVWLWDGPAAGEEELVES